MASAKIGCRYWHRIFYAFRSGAGSTLYWSTNPGHSVKFFLGLSWCQPIVELVWPDPVVPMHQIMTDVSVCFLSRHVANGRYPFGFQASKDTLHRRVVIAVAPATHALAHAVQPESLVKLAAAILRNLIRMEQQPLMFAALLMSHVQGLDHQICVRFP